MIHHISTKNESEVTINTIRTLVYEIPTDFPESDGTIEWDSTTLIVVVIQANDTTGFGFTYGHKAISQVIQSSFVPILKNSNAMNVTLLWEKMLDASRNIGSRGIAASAIAAVDIALWDLKAKILKLPLCTLWGQVRENVPIYGSGGFTSYTKAQLAKQFENWKKKGIDKFKMKVGRHPDQDVQRVKQARDVIGSLNQLFVDANGAYTRKQALDFGQRFNEFDVTWFEEPVSSDDLKGLHLLCYRMPPCINVAAGEYGYELF